MVDKIKNLKPDDESYYVDGKLICSSEPKFPSMENDSPGDVLLDRMRSMIRTEFSSMAAAHDLETFEEANDFDIEDDFELELPDTRYMEPEYPEGQQPFQPIKEAKSDSEGDVVSPSEPNAPAGDVSEDSPAKN